MIAENDSNLDEYWDMFENAATYSYARSNLEQKNKSDDNAESFHAKASHFSKEYVQRRNEVMRTAEIETRQEANNDLKEEIKALRSTMIEMQIQLNKVIIR